MESNRQYKIKDIIYTFLPVIIAVIIQYVVIIGDLFVIFISNLMSDERSVRSHTMGDILTEAYNQPMNRAYITVVQYALFILCFGIWFHHTFCGNFHISRLKLRKKRAFLVPLTAIFCGYSAQLMVDCILELLRPLFTDTFAAYDSIISDMTGAASSWLLVMTLVLFAPIGEELMFRGVIMHYALRYMPAYAAIIMQAVIFGLYHGNIIQCIYATLLGIALGCIAHSRESITYSILLHMAINASIYFVPTLIYKNTTTTAISLAVSAVVFIISFALLLTGKKVAAAKQ